MILKLPIINKRSLLLANARSKNKIATGVWEIEFGLGEKQFKYKPGQYIKITLPEVDLNHPKGNLREFSIIPTSDNQRSFKIAFRESDSDFKQALLAHSVGDLIKVLGPFGDFILPKKSTPLAMIAGGMGVTPFISMINSLSKQNTQYPVLLIYANSKLETTAYLTLLETLSNENIDFNFIHTQRRLIKKDLANYLENLSNGSTFLIAGSPNMVRDTRINLLNLGIKDNQIITEEFTGYS